MSWLASKKSVLVTILLLILLDIVLSTLFLVAAITFEYEVLLVMGLVITILLELLIVMGCLTLIGAISETKFFTVVRHSFFGNQ